MSNRHALSTNPDRVRERMDESRQEIADALLALRERLRIPYDWRGAVHRHPALVLLGAFAVGFLLARFSTRKRMRDEP